jgi:hypothetical protein
VDLNAIVDGLRGEGGVIFGLVLLVIVFFRGGVVTGKAYETTVNAYEKRLAQEKDETKYWRDTALRAIQAGEKATSGGS